MRANSRSRQQSNPETGVNSAKKQTAADDLQDSALLNFAENERFKNIRVHKNALTIAPSLPEHVELFREQEQARYLHPDRPWVYFNGDGSSSIVAPIIKKKNQQVNQKPREHS